MKCLGIRTLTLLALLVMLSCFGAQPVRADGKQDHEKPWMAVVPPTVPVLSVLQREDTQINPAQIMDQVVPRVAKDAQRKRWPFTIMPADTIGSVYQSVTGRDRIPTEDVAFTDLKPLAEKVGCRYLLVFKILELVAYYKPDFFDDIVRARAHIELLVYDHDADRYIWQIDKVGHTSHYHAYVGNSGLRPEQDGALNAAITSALEPFAKGQRKIVDRAAPQILISVQRVLGDGTKVLLDAGRAQNISVGDIFHSVESDSEITIVNVLDNGSIAEVLSGKPQEKEVFKPKP